MFSLIQLSAVFLRNYCNPEVAWTLLILSAVILRNPGKKELFIKADLDLGSGSSFRPLWIGTDNKQVSFMFAWWGLISIINTNSDTNISNLKSRLKHHMEENTWGLYKSNNVMRNGRGGWNYWIGVQLPTIGNRYLVLSSASHHQIRICRLYKLECGVLLTIMRIMSMMGVTGPANPKGSMVSWDTTQMKEDC